MADTKRKYIIQQKLTDGMLTLWPETVGSQIIQETEYRLIGKNTILLGGTYSGPDTNPSSLSTGAGNFSTTINAAGSLASNIVLTLPSRTGTIALTDDLPELSGFDGLLEGSYSNGEFKFEPYTVAGAGRLSWTSETAVSTTALAYSGNFYTNNLDVALNAVIDGTLTTSGLANLNGGIAVDTNKFTVAGDGTGNTYIAGTLEVDGKTQLDGVVDINNSTTIDGATISLDATSAGNFNVSGGDLILGATNILATGATEIDLTAPAIDINGTSSVTIDGTTVSIDASTTSNFTVTGTSGTASNLVLGAANTSTGTAQVQISAKSEIDLTAPAIDINGAVDISSTLAVGGNTTLAGDLAINGGDLTTTASTFNLLNKNLTDTQSYTLNIGQGSDTGTTTRLVNIGIGTTNVVIPGNLTVQGDNFIANTTTVTTDDDILQLRSSAVTAMTGYAGLVATKYDGTHDGALVFDNTGTAWVGDVTIQPNGSIVDVSMQAIATRETTPNATAIPFWDATTSKFITNTGFTFTNTGTILNIDNLSLDGNTIQSTNSNGNINLTPNGSGIVNLNAITNISGLLNANGGIAVDTNKFTVQDGTGNTNIAGTLAVSGITTLASLLNANGGIAVDTNKFTVQDGTGNTYVAGTLEVDGTTQLDGILDVNNSVDIDSVAGTLTADVQSISLDSTATSNFKVTGASSAASNLILDAANSSTGTASVLISAKTEIDLTAPNIDINGAADVSGALTAGSVSTTGAVTGLTFNKVTITQPANGATLTIADGKTINSLANLTVGAAGALGDITIKSSNGTAKTLTLDDNSTINSLTSGHVLYASAADTISSEAQLNVTRGGTGIGSYTAGDFIYASGASTLSKLAGVTSAKRKFLSQATSTPAWVDIVNDDLPESPAIAADITAYNAVNEPDVTEMTYTAVSVNSKGIVTAGAYVLEVGAPGQIAPSPELIFGGLFFKDVTV